MGQSGMSVIPGEAVEAEQAPSGVATSDGAIPVAEFVGRALARCGVRMCFGVVGSGNFLFTNALRHAGVRFVAARHENGAATMATAYAQLSSEVAVVSLHQGCGLTNAATGLAEAAKSRTPLVALAAESPANAVNSNFAMDQAGFVRSMGGETIRIHGAGSAVADLARAYQIARNERRCVLVNLPLDVQAQPVNPRTLEALPMLRPPSPPPPDLNALRRLVALIGTSRRPIILAGRGARHAGPVLRELGRLIGALLSTSAVAHGLFAGDPFDCGIAGGFSTPAVAKLISEADLVIAFGCSLNGWTTRRGKMLGDDAQIAQVDIEPATIGRNRRVTVGVVGDSATIARALTGDTLCGHMQADRYRTAKVRELLKAGAKWGDVPYRNLSTVEQIDPRDLTKRVNQMLPSERVVVVDSGNFMGYPSCLLDVPDVSGFCFTQAFQSIGLGLASCIGAALARPERLPVLGAGDGGFLMGIAGLETAVRLRLPILVIVYNDAAYGAEVHHFRSSSSSVDLSPVRFPDTDFAALARGFGAVGVTVRTAADLAPVEEWIESRPSVPLVIDAKIADDRGAWWLSQAFGH